MDKAKLQDWLDRHHVGVVRTFATTLEGVVVGKHLHRDKFMKSLPEGHTISDMSLSMDLSGFPHMTFWHNQRASTFGDVHLKPDLTTLISDGIDPDLGHCICDFTDQAGNPLELCPRSTLKRLVGELGGLGYSMKATFELEFYLFHESFDDARRKGFRNLRPVSTSAAPIIYLARNAYRQAPFMKEVTRRLDWKGIKWEGWNTEAGTGQIELNLVPTDPVTAADQVQRVKQIIFEVAVDQGLSATFMAKPGDSYGSGMHIHHSLEKDGKAAFYLEGGRSPLVLEWIAGLLATLPAAVSFLCPTINSFRRLVDFSAVPTVALWGEENKSAAVRLISGSESAARVEYRLGASDLNPYLALAVIIAAGLTGVRQHLTPPPEFNRLGWGLPGTQERLPNTISKAAAALKADTLLAAALGRNFVDYWINTRENEWLAYHTEGSDPASKSVSDWELSRYFSLI